MVPLRLRRKLELKKVVPVLSPTNAVYDLASDARFPSRGSRVMLCEVPTYGPPTSPAELTT